MKERLYLAFDESNHGRSPEILVMVYSWLENDVKERMTNKRERMDERRLNKWFDNSERWYCYVIAPAKSIEQRKKEEGEHHFVTLCPLLIRTYAEFFSRHCGNKLTIPRIDILLDGDIRDVDACRLRKSVGLIRRMRVGPIIHYPKRGHGDYLYPEILCVADSLACKLFKGYKKGKIESDRQHFVIDTHFSFE